MKIRLPELLGFVCLALFSCLFSTFLSGCGSSPSGVGTATSVATPLAIASVSPRDVPVGSPAVMIVVTGTGFTSNSVIQLSGTSVQTTFISSTELRATIPASQLQTGTILKLAVVDGTHVADADSSNNVQVSNPVPTVTTLAPSSVLVGSSAGTITVNGTNFVAGSPSPLMAALAARHTLVPHSSLPVLPRTTS
jgi:hypothetical protein